jgi:hypothetical protein
VATAKNATWSQENVITRYTPRRNNFDKNSGNGLAMIFAKAYIDSVEWMTNANERGTKMLTTLAILVVILAATVIWTEVTCRGNEYDLRKSGY